MGPKSFASGKGKRASKPIADSSHNHQQNDNEDISSRSSMANINSAALSSSSQQSNTQGKKRPKIAANVSLSNQLSVPITFPDSPITGNSTIKDADSNKLIGTNSSSSIDFEDLSMLPDSPIKTNLTVKRSCPTLQTITIKEKQLSYINTKTEYSPINKSIMLSFKKFAKDQIEVEKAVDTLFTKKHEDNRVLNKVKLVGLLLLNCVKLNHENCDESVMNLLPTANDLYNEIYKEVYITRQTELDRIDPSHAHSLTQQALIPRKSQQWGKQQSRRLANCFIEVVGHIPLIYFCF